MLQINCYKRYIVFLLIIAFLLGSKAAYSLTHSDLNHNSLNSEKKKKLKKADKDAKDSVLLEFNDSTLLSFETDSLQLSDSLKLKGYKSDTMFISGGVFPTMREKFLDEQTRIASLYDTTSNDKMTRKVREKMQRDSLGIKSFGQTVGMSFLVPGYGQFKNDQKWKIPILYATTGSLAYLSVRASKNFKRYNNAYENAIKIGVPQKNIDEILVKKNAYNTQKTLFMAGTAISYLYFVGDAAINYKGDVHPTRKATILSAIFPGAGQVYNKSYWKLPIIYGGLATFGYIIDYNGRGYKRFKTAYEYLSDGDDSTVDEFNGYYSETFLQNTRDSYRRYRDLGIIMMCGFYLLNIIDAHVDAYLRRYDISDDLAVKIEPTIISKPKATSLSSFDGVGLSMKFNF